MHEARLANSRRKRKYAPSHSELLVEEMCEAYGCELQPATVLGRGDSTLLTRLATPAVIEHEGLVRTIQVQYTRFSMLEGDLWRQVLGTRLGLKHPQLEYEALQNHLLSKKGDGWDPLDLVTDSRYFAEDLVVHRWPKEAYFAVFDGVLEEPAQIHRNASNEGAVVKITYCRAPVYAGSRGERGPDKISFEFPRARSFHDRGFDHADMMHNLQGELHGPAFVQTTQLSEPSSSTLALAHIHAYLKRAVLGKTLT